MQDPNTANQGD